MQTFQNRHFSCAADSGISEQCLERPGAWICPIRRARKPRRSRVTARAVSLAGRAGAPTRSPPRRQRPPGDGGEDTSQGGAARRPERCPGAAWVAVVGQALRAGNLDQIGNFVAQRGERRASPEFLEFAAYVRGRGRRPFRVSRHLRVATACSRRTLRFHPFGTHQQLF